MTIKPLQGVRVLDVTNVLAGPFCCHQLAYMGAEVIKVEACAGGDLARQLGADVALNDALMGVSFLAQNSGKRSITLDLKTQQGVSVFRRLVRTSQVVVENFRPGVMNRLGLGFEALKSENSTLIYCAISGFGQDGPLRDLPAYDQIIQGMSGVMSVTGSNDSAPLRVGYPVADSIGGMTAAFAIAASLANPNRSEAVFLDVSMLEATMATMGWAISNFLVAGREPQPMGNDNVTASPSGTFRTRDGLINIAANKQEQFEAVCKVVRHPEWIQDVRFVDRHARMQNRSELKSMLENMLATQSTEEWWKRLNAAGVPSGPVYTVPQALSHPQIVGRDMLSTYEDVPGVGRDVCIVGTGFKINEIAPKVAAPPPQLGQHTDAILTELGYSGVEIQAFRAEGVI
jgi:CoA:oxalate CoA-transferase